VISMAPEPDDDAGVDRLTGDPVHDLNNLLASILLYSELLLADTDAADPRHADLLVIQQAGLGAAELARHLPIAAPGHPGPREGSDQAAMSPNDQALLADLSRLNSEMANLQREMARKNQDLESARREIKTLQGLIPICSGCNEIRDEKEVWVQLEAYMLEHADARFSHSLCPACAKAFLDTVEDP